MSKTIPGPKPITHLLGVLKILPEVQQDIRGMVQRLVDEYGDFIVFEIMGGKQYIISNAEIAHEVLVKQADKFIKEIGYRDTHHGMARFFGNGLLTSDGEFWKRQRKLVAPALHTRRIAAYAETMVAFTLTQLDGWRDGARYDINREMNALTMKIVSKSLFNVEMEAEIRPLGDALYAVQDFFRLTQFIALPTWVPTPVELRARQAGKTMDDFVYGIIRERRASSNEDKGDLLSMLLLAQDDDGNGMSDVQIRDEVLTAFLAGHETTANALNWTWMLLAQHPQIEAKLHHELDTVLAGRTPTLADLKQLPYTEMVIKESLRLYPPAWSYSREAIEDVTVNDYVIPKGGVVQVYAYGLHRNPAYWEQPNAFIPERFSPENEGKLVKNAYAPFGGGPRICVGNAFALMEAQLLLATIAQRYTLRLLPGHVVVPEAMITMFPKGGLPMTVHRRQPVTSQPASEALVMA